MRRNQHIQINKKKFFPLILLIIAIIVIVIILIFFSSKANQPRVEEIIPTPTPEITETPEVIVSTTVPPTTGVPPTTTTEPTPVNKTYTYNGPQYSVRFTYHVNNGVPSTKEDTPTGSFNVPGKTAHRAAFNLSKLNVFFGYTANPGGPGTQYTEKYELRSQDNKLFNVYRNNFGDEIGLAGEWFQKIAENNYQIVRITIRFKEKDLSYAQAKQYLNQAITTGAFTFK